MSTYSTQVKNGVRIDKIMSTSHKVLNLLLLGEVHSGPIWSFVDQNLIVIVGDEIEPEVTSVMNQVNVFDLSHF